MFNVARRRKEKELTRPSHMIHFFVSFHIFPGFIIRFFSEYFADKSFFSVFGKSYVFPTDTNQFFLFHQFKGMILIENSQF